MRITTLTGADLRRWRQAVPVPQVCRRGRPAPGLSVHGCAWLFGCESGTIYRAEGAPGKALQPWLAEALASAIRGTSPSWRARLKEAVSMKRRNEQAQV